jgi:sulfotransferase family protein
MHAVLLDGTFQGRAADRDFAIQVFPPHNAAVREEVPADRLLVFDVAQDGRRCAASSMSPSR